MSSSSTTQACFDRCKDRDSKPTHFGLQNEKECFCGDDSQLDKHDDPEKPPACNSPCAGDPDETCGGHGAMTVYEMGIADDTSDPGYDFERLGCYADEKGPKRVMKYKTRSSEMMPVTPMTSEVSLVFFFPFFFSFLIPVQ